MPRFLPLLAFLGCALNALAAPDSPAPPPAVPAAPPAAASQAPLPAAPPKAEVIAEEKTSAPAAPDAVAAPAPAVASTPAPTATAVTDSTPTAAKPGPAFSPVEKFDRAVAAYEAGHYDEARQAFLALVDDGHLSAPLAHNLGNIEYKSGNEGLASLWYRRALALQPISPETLQNMRFLHGKTGFQSWDNTDGFIGLSISHFNFIPAAGLTILGGWAALILLVWLLWWTPRPGRRWPLIVLVVLTLPFTALSGALWWLLQNDAHPLTKRYVLTAPETEAYAAPAEASTGLIRLPTGSEVMPLETRGNWFYCEIPTGRPLAGSDSNQGPLRGWVRASLLQPLWPWPAPPQG